MRKDFGVFTEDLTKDRDIYEVSYMWVRRLEDTISFLEQKGMLEDATKDIFNVLDFLEEKLFPEIEFGGREHKSKILESKEHLKSELNREVPSKAIVIEKGTELIENLKPYLKSRIDKRNKL
ncbi:hypothetical protein [Natranaerofaba carboxydovora]|uniref:hypothetical protein n=1 Tax=Natranaerofaba carboxydovora TaxID=2742683 RepID=UPI001F133BBD|nr:hypothetical protein [Natranaerofaba carboxydovora]UMZ75024.1 hypothetical protein ACONDI_02634 [Natranaerofaba carboxydovora]